MGMYDYMTLNHPMFGDDLGHTGQTKDMSEAPFMEKYEITPDGKILYTEVEYEDQSDPNAAPGSIESISGCMTPVPTGKKVEIPWHGFVWVWGKGDYQWKCKFTDGVLVDAEKTSTDPKGRGPVETRPE